MPTDPPILFAVTTKDRCAQDIPYGPDDSLLTNTVARRAKFGSTVDAYFSTKHKDAMHAAWLQKFYRCKQPTCTTGGDLLFEIFWSFSSVKSLKSRFIDASSPWDPDGESVTWTITSQDKEIIKRGQWRFSAKANEIDHLANVFDSQVLAHVRVYVRDCVLVCNLATCTLLFIPWYGQVWVTCCILLASSCVRSTNLRVSSQLLLTSLHLLVYVVYACM